ncbi:hypothetical protein COU78_05135 [Candidatus Peregrinibacteria bacterium CG10_big_fil_rev_8_21_14_0_10_49_24]|nr:MAG: hypothetical protein COV83_01505 [Candidatus Peregrinibacteria bacterium CG11_big_fil_rev_8_21_14_0_20_49_14]PIR50729.1 MAG: hypothetical protein COU78_05135 [Candidatus Peregrinibacteria bacterium CG10_big_fil_rev_8_21_14_0_10_49_24]PJA68226.1 MAG: hypothetical protein CO157_00675 [Candidatus Peregrinibacteria bacterium CG_4_9_14_3_um_filter_49_12]
MTWTAEQALKHWQKKGLLTKAKASELAASLKDSDHADEHGIPRAVGIFATVGAVLVGLGILLFIGSNWADMTPFQRIAVLFLGYAVVAAGAYVAENHTFNRTSEALWLLTDIVFGANIMLLAQIFHFSLTYWQGPFLWMLGTLSMGFARQEKVHGYLAVPLGILALGWVGSGGGRFFGGQMEFLGESDNILPLLSLLGMGMVSASLLTRRNEKFAFLHEALMSWGVLLVTVPLIVSSADSSIPQEMYKMTGSVKQWIIIGSSVALTVGAIFQGDMKRSELRGYLLVFLALFGALLLQRDGHSMVGDIMENNAFLYFLYVLVLFVLSLWSVWMGVLCQNARLLNYGIAAAAIIITIQYFSWSFLLLDKSLAFIIGGILLIVMTLLIERKRKKLISTFTAS